MPAKISFSDFKVDGGTFKWSNGFEAKFNGKMTKAQEYVDSEVLRLCDPYVPLDRGTLKSSATVATKIGSGEVIWNTPYAAKMYYGDSYVFSGAPIKGSHWGERAMNNGGKTAIQKGVAAILK